MNLTYTDIAAIAGFVVLTAGKDCVIVAPARDQFQFRDGAPESISIFPECIEYRYAHGLTESVFPDNGNLVANLTEAMTHEVQEEEAAHELLMARFRMRHAA